MIYVRWSLICGVLALMISGCYPVADTHDIPAVDGFDVARYMGRWYEIARLPHYFERGVVDPSAEYTLQDNGRINVINRGWRNGEKIFVRGWAEPVKANTGELKVCFQWPFKGLYKIIYLSGDYQTAIVTSASKDHLWILSRNPVMSKRELADCLKKISRWGFAVDLLQYPTGGIERWLQ